MCRLLSSLSALLLLGAVTPGQSVEKLTIGGVYFDAQKPAHLELLIEPSAPLSASADAFQLLENSEASARSKALDRFRDSPWSVAVVLAVDTSGSMSDHIGNRRGSSSKLIDEVKSALRDFVPTFEDALSLVKFGDKVEGPTPFGGKGEIGAAIDGLEAKSRETHLYEALGKTLEFLKTRAKERERQRIIVVSDGAEENSKESPRIESIIEIAKQQRVAIDTIWIEKGTDSWTENTLLLLSRETGGMSGEATNASAVAAMLKGVMQRIDNALVVSFDRTSSIPLTQTVAVRLSQKPEIASAPIAVQLPGHATRPNWRDRIMDYIGVLAVLGILLLVGVAVAIYVLIAWSRGKKQEPQAPPLVNGNVEKQEPKRRPTVVSHTGTTGSLSLQVVKGPLAGKTIPVDGPRFRIGADSENELRIETDSYLSGSHALLESSEKGWTLTDQQSRNGTMVDGQKLKGGQGYVLRDGQSVQCGGTEFRVVFGSRANPNPIPQQDSKPPDKLV